MEQELQQFLNRMRIVQSNLLQFIEKDDNLEENYQAFIQIMEDLKITENAQNFRLTLHLINVISNNHFRSSNFFDKFEKILHNYKSQIKQTFSNFQIFYIFKKNRRILLFLIEDEIINIDETIASYISKENREFFYCEYFTTELQPFKTILILLNEDEEIDNKKRRIGENDSQISQIIRKDLINDFIEFVNTNRLSLDMKINNSKYETNPVFIVEEPTLIEYAAFFGSYQIFFYLYNNGISLTPSLWDFAVHGNNMNIIQFLKEKNIKPQFGLFELTLKEAFKCHHNEVANYIIQNLISNYDASLINDSTDFYDNFLVYCFRYYNFFFLPNNFVNKFTFLYACYYDYFFIVEFLLKTSKIDLNFSIILNSFVFKK